MGVDPGQAAFERGGSHPGEIEKGVNTGQGGNGGIYTGQTEIDVPMRSAHPPQSARCPHGKICSRVLVLWCFGALYQTHIVSPRTPNFHFELKDKLRILGQGSGGRDLRFRSLGVGDRGGSLGFRL